MSSANFDPIRAFIFYQPGNSSTEPPAASSVLWDISGAAKWRSQSLYPVFAVSGSVGQEMMRQISLYSGNVTEVPYGANITQLLDPDPGDFVRIWTNITLSPPSGVFGIWVYFLIIVAVLVGIISATSLLMHLAQARRRLLLRRRVISGEVNLEGMGIKRLTVPISAVKEFPLYTYHYEPTTGQPVSPKPPEVPTTQQSQNSSISAISKAAGPHATFVATHYQPVCSICLVEFQNRLTVIREIHCGHIFHRECIDEFLGEISSLCPVCKASMLPQGHCPKITNSMVRQEYALRRLRHNATAEEDRQESKHDGKIPSFSVAALKHFFRERRIGASPFVSEETSTPPPPITPVARRTQPQQYEETRETTATAARERMRELAGAGSQVSNDMARLSRCKSAISVRAVVWRLGGPGMADCCLIQGNG